MKRKSCNPAEAQRDRRRMVLRSCIVAACLSATLFVVSCSSNRIPKSAVKQYLQGEDFYVAGRLQAAAAVFDRLSVRYPSFYQARLMDAKSLYLLHRDEPAETALSKLVHDYPQYHGAQIWLVRVEVERRELTRAQQRLQTLLSFDSHDPRLLLLMSEIRSDQGKYQQAIAYLNKAADSAQELAEVHLDLGRLYYRFGLDGKARSELKTVTLLLPSKSPLRGAVATLLGRLGQGGRGE